jgi:predicted dehydrogenase
MYHVGQYLPDWHPWENYRDFFVGDRRTNGCREIFAIDLPWILRAFGPVARLRVAKDKLTALSIDYPDNYLVTLEHEDGSKGLMCVDVVSRKATRSLEIFNEDLHLFWHGTPDSLAEYDLVRRELVHVDTYESTEHDPRYSDNIIEDAYREEILGFFRAIEGSQEPLYTLSDDIATLDLIDRIEGAEG